MGFKVEPVDKDKKKQTDIVVNFDKSTRMMAYIIRLRGTHRETGDVMYLGRGIQGCFWTSNKSWAATWPTKPGAELEFMGLGLTADVADIVDTEWSVA